MKEKKSNTRLILAIYCEMKAACLDILHEILSGKKNKKPKTKTQDWKT